MIDNSRAKLAKKNLDMVAANNVKVEGAGFQGDTNVLTLITQDEEISLPLMSKEDAAFRILIKSFADAGFCLLRNRTIKKLEINNYDFSN